MKYIQNIIPCILLFFATFATQISPGQQKFKYNFNAENGLPSNHVCNIIEDKFGYLWFTTPKGIVKYNGYDFRFFGLPDGLSTEDNWELFEDKKGRMWLGSNSEEIGYLYHNNYHKAILENISTEIFPQHMHSFNNGIIFSSPFLNKSNHPILCIESNDTIRKINISDTFFEQLATYLPPYKQKYAVPSLNEKNEICFFLNKHIYNCKIRNNALICETKLLINDTDFFQKNFSNPYFSIGDLMIYYQTIPKINSFNFLNTKTGQTKTIYIDSFVNNENIEHIYYEKSTIKQVCFYIITENKILKYNPKNPSRPEQIFDLDSFRTSPTMYGSEIKVYCQSRFWGSLIGSNTSGADALLKYENHFKKEPGISLSGFKYVGGSTDHQQFWWNKTSSTLAQIDSHFHVKFSIHKKLSTIGNIVPYNTDTFYAVGSDLHTTQWFLSKYNKFIPSNIDSIGKTIITIDVDKNGDLYIVDSRFFFELKLLQGRIERRRSEAGKYFDMVRDELSNSYLAYNAFKISVHGEKDSTISRNKIHELEIDRIDKIVIDNKYGNVFIKGSSKNESKLMICDLHTYKHTELFRNYNLKGAQVVIYKGRIIVAGRFGILFCKILARDKLSDPVIYPNIKDINYKNITDIQTSWNRLLLSTDKGFYSVKIPPDNFIEDNSPAQNNFKLILQNNDSFRTVTKNDTIVIDQKDYHLQFDIINALGNGKLWYNYKLSGSEKWVQLNSNELTLPANIKPGTYHTLSLKFYDNVWRSDIITITIYVTPYWWQSLFQSHLFWAGLILIVIALSLLLIYFTRRATNRNNLRRNLQQEMELKSVHSQINPHFIFNTLNTALFFIKKKKMDEAYEHVSKFSRLLRAYIKSSRSKYISIADEVVNLNNYIQLQQSRFEDKFDYEIRVDDKIDTAQIKIPALLLQPIVENAIDHGLFHKTEHGHLKIEFKKIPLSNEIQCIVDDDGIGRRMAKILSADSLVKAESYGDSLVKDLIAVFNKYEKTGISINYIDKPEPESGTTVVVTIKNPLHEK